MIERAKNLGAFIGNLIRALKSGYIKFETFEDMLIDALQDMPSNVAEDLISAYDSQIEAGGSINPNMQIYINTWN